MKKKIYAPQAKAAAVLLILVGLVGAAMGGVYAMMAAYVGGYDGEAGYYSSAAYYRAVDQYIGDADWWYYLTQERANQDYSERSYADEQRYKQLTERLQSASLHAVREEKNGDLILQTPIAATKVGTSWEQLDYREGYRGDDETYGYRIYFDQNASADDDFVQGLRLHRQTYPNRFNYLIFVGIALLMVLVSWVYLLVVSGRNANGEIVLRGIHRVPLDLLTILFLIPSMLGIAVVSESSMYSADFAFMRMLLALAMVAAAAALVMGMVWVHTVVARLKGRMLLRSTLMGMVCIRIWRSLRGGARQVVAAGQKVVARGVTRDANNPAQEEAAVRQGLQIDWRESRAAGLLGKLSRACRVATLQIITLLRNLNVIWKLCGVVALVLAVVELMATQGAYGGGMAILLVVNVLILLAVGFFAVQVDRLKKGGEHLANGDLNYKIPTDHMYWDLQQHAKNLNAISDGMAVAVEERLKSERMKYELLTNVSHDIKTPLTSIINYVDLLKGEEIAGEQTQEYLAVLDRQSAKLKKLITDLIEVSKATTGNVSVEAARMQAGELLRQCVGEYSERFAEKRLEAVLRVPDDEPSIYADGRLLWRVFDNLLGNMVKYAMPGTRVYLDLETQGNRVMISLKNISGERLNIAAAELVERFVRGDVSRATEGSGLGLSIARSLVELMDGEFELTIDGDLFKIVMVFAKMDNK